MKRENEVIPRRGVRMPRGSKPEHREKRPSPISGWREQKRRARGVSANLDADSHSVWIRRGIFLISALELADAPDGKGDAILQWHLSMSLYTDAHSVRCSDIDCAQALTSFGLVGAEEDNHHPGVARHFWMPVDPSRRVACECKTTEETVTEPDGYRWSNDPNACRGCEIAPLIGKPCPLHPPTPPQVEYETVSTSGDSMTLKVRP